MIRNLTCAMLGCVLLLGCFGVCFAETPQQQAVSIAIREDGFNPIWLTQKWDEKVNLPYAAKATEIEKLLTRKVAPALILKKYQAAARQKPSDSLAIFPWIYARYRLVESGAIKKPLPELCNDLYKELVLAPPPASAEYARLRFKVESQTHLSSRLEQIGARLVARYKNDEKLMLAYNNIVAQHGSLATAVSNDRAMIKSNPQEPGYRFNLATDLTSLSWLRRDPKLLDEGEAQFKLFEKLAPPNHPLRRRLLNEYEYIRLKRLRFAGKKP